MARSDPETFTAARAAVAIFDNLRRTVLALPVDYQLTLIEALAGGDNLSPLYAADDLTAACDKARDEMEPVEREPVDPYFAGAWA